MNRDLNKRCNKALIKDYLSNPNQSMEELAKKHGYKSHQAASYQVSKFLKICKTNKKIILQPSYF